MASEPRTHLGKYQLVGVVGEGAMGVVHKAFDPVLNRTLAIKVMSSVIGSDEQLRERFLREARAAGSLQHPNVITIFDFGEISEHLFIAMEFVEGYDLAEIVSKRVPLAIEAKLDILIDTLNGLGYAHSHGVVHRDIKPANIRVTVDGRAKLMDFGIAHLSASDLTKSGEMIGTPQYMAPEQVTGDPITPASDIFSLGCVGYELFSNVRPFDGETLHAVLFNIVSHDPPPLSSLVPSLPADLDDLFSSALAKDPKKRFESAAAMSRALLHVRQVVAPRRDSASVILRDAERSAARAGALPSTRRRSSTKLIPGGARRLRRVGIAAGAVAVVALGWWAPWKGGSPSDADPSEAAALSSPQSAAISPGTEIPPPVSAAASPAPTRTEPASTRSESAPRGIEPAPAAARSTAASAARDTLVTAFRTNALEARRLAVSAGATALELSEGDLELQAADAMAAGGRPSDAIARLSAASQRWTSAERVARDRAAAVDARRAEPVSAPLAAAPTVLQPPPAAAAGTTVTTPRPVTAAESREEIDRVIQAYELAIESGDIARIRRAYPGMTAPQQANWEAFFRSARDFRATFTTTRFEPADDRAVVSVDAVYEYDNRSTSREDRNELKLQFTVARDASGGWRLTAVR